MAKKLKLKLPKRIAGVRIPKSVRKGPIADFLNSSTGQAVVAQSLVAVAGVLGAAKAADTDVRDFVRHPVDNSRKAGRAAVRAGGDQAERLSYALREAAQAFRQAMEEGPHAQEAVDVSDTEAAAKKKSSPKESAATH